MDPAYAAVHAEEDRLHWWFRGRQAVILAEMARRLPSRPARIAELGCGSGGLLEALGRLGPAVGVESDPLLRAAARARGLDVRPGALPDDIPLAPGECDAVCLFDVLEHVADEAAALRASARLLRPGGRLFVTVPAYQWLWSRHDQVLGHHRRYTAGRLRRALAGAGLAVERLTYFNTLLAPAVVAVRWAGRLLGREAHDLRRPPAALNSLLARLFALEAPLLRLGRFPFGISILAVARRPS
jgi:SAM-dependent methyltransferase